jgi:hypothetical protein
VVVKGELKALGKKLSEKLLSDVEMIVECFFSSGRRAYFL